MNAFMITFRSVTHAQRGERILTRAGIPCTVQRTPRRMEEQGCGYSLRLRTGNITAVLELLRREELPLRKIYLRRGDAWEELAL